MGAISFFHSQNKGIFKPSTFGAFLWLEADYGVTVNGSGHVTQVLDQSSGGRNMAASVGGAQTTVTASAINGQPALTMTNSRHLFSFGTLVSGGFWVLAVAKFEPTASLNYLFDSQVNNNRTVFYTTPTNYEASAGAIVNVGPIDANFNLHTFRFRGVGTGTGKYSKNAGAFADHIFMQNYLVEWQIGQRYNGGSPFNGKLAAFIIEPTEARALDTMAYLKSKYGF